MVGGEIIGLSVWGGKVHVNVAQCSHYPKHALDKCPRQDECCVYTDAIQDDGSPANLAIGDMLWWQSGTCYWTPAVNRISSEEADRLGHRCGIHHDIKLKKIGYSH